MVAKDHKARRPKFHSVLWLCNPQRTKPPEGGCQRYYAPSPPPLSTLVIVVRPPHRVLRFYSCSFLRLQRGTVTGTVTGTGPRFHKSQPQESVWLLRQTLSGSGKWVVLWYDMQSSTLCARR